MQCEFPVWWYHLEMWARQDVFLEASENNGFSPRGIFKLLQNVYFKPNLFCSASYTPNFYSKMHHVTYSNDFIWCWVSHATYSNDFIGCCVSCDEWCKWLSYKLKFYLRAFSLVQNRGRSRNTTEPTSISRCLLPLVVFTRKWTLCWTHFH